MVSAPRAAQLVGARGGAAMIAQLLAAQPDQAARIALIAEVAAVDPEAGSGGCTAADCMLDVLREIDLLPR